MGLLRAAADHTVMHAYTIGEFEFRLLDLVVT